MKILHVIPTYLPAWRYGGPMRSVHGLAVAQAAAGDEATVFTTDVDGSASLPVPLEQPVDRDGVRVWYFPARVLRRLCFAPALGRALRVRIAEFDVVHIHSVFLWPTLAAARHAARTSIPYVVSPRGMLVPELVARRGKWRKTVWIELFERRTLRLAATVVASSETERRQLLSLGMDKSPIAVIPNGIAPDGTTPVEPTEAPPLPALASLQPIVLFLGRLTWKKGLEVLIPALAHVPGARLVVAGNDEERLRPRLERLAREAGVSERVHFAGEVRGAHKVALLAAARVFVLPSLSENFGVAALEALAAGTPVVLTPEVGLAEAVRQAGAGVVCEREPAALAAAITAILGDSAMATRMGERGRQLAADHFSWPAIAAAMREIYLRATSAQPPQSAGSVRAAS